MPLDDLVLAADLEFPGLEALADVLPEETLDDQLPSVGEAVLELDLMGLPAPLLLSRSRIDRSVLLDCGLAFLHVGRTHIELGAGRLTRQHKQDNAETKRSERVPRRRKRLHTYSPRSQA